MFSYSQLLLFSRIIYGELLLFSRMFSYGEFKQEDQEKMLEQLNKKVEEVYRSCIGDNEANIRLVDLSISYVPVLLHARSWVEEL